MVMTEAEGVPVSLFTTSAQMAEVNTIQTLTDSVSLRPDSGEAD